MATASIPPDPGWARTSQVTLPVESVQDWKKTAQVRSYCREQLTSLMRRIGAPPWRS